MKFDLTSLSEEIRNIRGSVYFLGIGGSGMFGVAMLAHEMGFSVCGTDSRAGKNTVRLASHTIPLYLEEESLPEDISALVYSLAVRMDHPRMREALSRGIPVFSRPEFFGELMRAFPIRAAVAGSHGKSSTTAMCAEILRQAGLSPTVVSGADLDGEGSFRRGEGGILLFEACEYKDAFLSFSPTHVLVLDVSWEHTDYFPDEESVMRSFFAFLHKETVCRSIAPLGLFSPDITFGNGGYYTAERVEQMEGGNRFLLSCSGDTIGEVTLRVEGEFQVENAVGAAALCISLGAPHDAVLRGLSAYRGIARRMEKKGYLQGSPLYLDFAHHPKELFCAIKTAERFGRPVALVFEPHTYSRTKSFWKDFVHAFRRPYKAGVLPIYAAREDAVSGVSSDLLAREAGIAFLPDYPCAASFLEEAAKEGCTLLLAGAGSVEGVLSHLFLSRNEDSRC